MNLQKGIEGYTNRNFRLISIKKQNMKKKCLTIQMGAKLILNLYNYNNIGEHVLNTYYQL